MDAAQQQMAIAPQSMRSNALLSLDDPHSNWLVRSGSLALFAVQLRQGKAEGERRYLFSVAAG
ncbi:MAG TPA: hypothetical protein V6C88_12780, partial [Chroococcidiopsis sp.]